MDLQSILAALPALIKVEQLLGIKLGDISAIKEIHSLRMSLADITNNIHTVNLQFVLGDQNNQIINVFSSDRKTSYQIPLGELSDRNVTIIEDSHRAKINAIPEIQARMINIDSGLHLIINSQNWFNGNQATRVNDRCVLTPVIHPDARCSCGNMEAGRRISVQFSNSLPKSLVLNWPLDPTEVIIHPDSAIEVGNSSWLIRKLTLEHPIYLDTERTQILSCDEKYVREIWELIRTHKPADGSKPSRPVQKFLFVVNRS